MLSRASASALDPSDCFVTRYRFVPLSFGFVWALSFFLSSITNTKKRRLVHKYLHIDDSYHAMYGAPKNRDCLLDAFFLFVAPYIQAFLTWNYPFDVWFQLTSLLCCYHVKFSSTSWRRNIREQIESKKSKNK